MDGRLLLAAAFLALAPCAASAQAPAPTLPDAPTINPIVPAPVQNPDPATGGPASNTSSKTCPTTSQLVQGINCGIWPASLQSDCYQTQKDRMTLDDCNKAEQYSQSVPPSGQHKPECDSQTFNKGTSAVSFTKACAPTTTDMGTTGDGSQALDLMGIIAGAAGGGGDSSGTTGSIGFPLAPGTIGYVASTIASLAGVNSQYSNCGLTYPGSGLNISPCPNSLSNPSTGLGSIGGIGGIGGGGSSGGSSGGGYSGGGTSGGGTSGGGYSGGGGTSGGGTSGSGTSGSGTSGGSSGGSGGVAASSYDNQCYQKLKGMNAKFQPKGQVNFSGPAGTCTVQLSVSYSNQDVAWSTSNMDCNLAILWESFGKKLKGIGVSKVGNFGTIACRTMNNGRTASSTMSKHAYGYAADMDPWVMNGQTVSGTSYFTDPSARASLNQIVQTACEAFNLVLAYNFYQGRQGIHHIHAQFSQHGCDPPQRH